MEREVDWLCARGSGWLARYVLLRPTALLPFLSFSSLLVDRLVGDETESSKRDVVLLHCFIERRKCSPTRSYTMLETSYNSPRVFYWQRFYTCCFFGSPVGLRGVHVPSIFFVSFLRLRLWLQVAGSLWESLIPVLFNTFIEKEIWLLTVLRNGATIWT